MKTQCLYCTTELPVDSDSNHVTCPKCGSEFFVTGHGRLIDIIPTEETTYEPTEND